MRKTFHFGEVKKVEEVKKAYRVLAKKYHPDLNHDKDTTQIMKEINLEYEYLIELLTGKAKNKGANASYQDKQEAKQSAHDGYREIIIAILKMENMKNNKIEIIGTWIWITGSYEDMKPIIQNLKDLDFWYSGKHKAWIWSEGGRKAGARRSKLTKDEIKDRHGAQTVNEGKTRKAN